MTLNEYQREAKITAVYKKAGQGEIIYPTLGLCSEAGEFAGVVKKVLRGDSFTAGSLRERLISELGDVLWYVSACATELGLELNDVAEHNIAKLTVRAMQDKIKGSGDER